MNQVATLLSPSKFRKLEPVIRRLLILAILFGQIAYHFSWTNVQLDPDIWWHLSTGRWIAQHGTVPSTDPFSEYGQSRPWVAYTWLFDLVVFEAHRLQGAIGIEYVKAALGMIFALALYFLCQRLAGSFGLGVILTILALVSTLPLATPRPWLFTMVFFGLALLLLTRLRNDGRKAAIWALPLLFALWANLHVQFIYGLILVGLFLMEAIQNRFMRSAERFTGNWRDAKLYAGILAACAAAACLNPYGARLYSTVWDYAHQADIYLLIQELSPPNFRSPTHWLFMGLTLGGFLVLGRRKATSALPYLLLVFGLCSALRMQRDAWLAAIAGAAVLAGWPSGRQNDGGEPDPEWTPRFPVVLAVAVAGLIVILGLARTSGADLEREIPQHFPAGAVRHISSRGLPGPLYNDFGWGGYLTWALPNLPVSMDGRTNVHRPERILRSYLTWGGQRIWAEDPDLQKARLVLAPRNQALTTILRQDDRFHLDYEDDLAVVLVRKPNR
ncbi:MAG: hypothetical protein ACE15E_06240 [Acidobacteriota bacterium]